MIAKKPWLLTKKGLKFLTKCAVGLSIGSLCAEVFPNTLLVPGNRTEQERAMVAKLGTKDVPYQVQEYVRRTLTDLKFTEDQRKGLTVYLSDFDESGVNGNVSSMFGALVKLPWCMWKHYPLPDSIDGDDGLHPEATQQYLDSIRWSDKGKLFYTAYYLAWTTKFEFIFQGLLNAVGIGSAYTTCYVLSKSKHPVTENPRALLIAYLLILLFFYVSWMFATDVANCESEEKIIRQVCELGEDYAEGALEVFTKQQQHNKAIRELLGFVGRLKIAESGNTRTPRRANIPLDERIAIAQEYVDKYRRENSSSSDGSKD